MSSFLQNGMGTETQQSAPPDNGKMVDLSSRIDKSESYGRNVQSSCPITNLFIGDSRLGCKSDADEQLILHVAFNETVKVRFYLQRE